MFGSTARLESQIAQLQRRLSQQEQMLQLLAQRAGVDLGPLAVQAEEASMPSAVRTELERGNLIAAIKEYRTATGTGLAEAKRAVEAYADSRGLRR
ncbi:hypothetical protein [Brachybacterium hainanense]|uniref:Ribosomal protein L7/L12 C-terminal domain-containing protein n=1 Tax=Brachybacterium hainanense TaxID=1541174 RepID=A0ABV6RDM7_9MICO